MRQASWNEMFASRGAAFALAPEVPSEPTGWRRLVWWEDLVTFALLSVIFLTVMASIDRAQWVDDMPALYPIAAFGLVVGALLSRLRWPEGFVHLMALVTGAAASLIQVLALLPGRWPWDRYAALEERMGAWFNEAFSGGISNDSLPFIILVVCLSWLAAYLSSWAIFRWQNAWLGLIPGGFALLMNISYLPGQFSFAFVVFLFGGALLVTRLHLMERARVWREDATPYPPLLSLSVLHATVWLALVLVGLAWLLPQANEAGPLESVWRRATAPVTERVEGLGRLFVSVNARKPVRVHNFDEALPLQGPIELPETLVLDVETETLDQPAYLRAEIYDVYARNGWTQSSGTRVPLLAGDSPPLPRGAPLEERTIRIESKGRSGDTIFTIGQPSGVDRDVTIRIGARPQDVTGVESDGRLRSGDAYESAGNVSAATEDDLRGATMRYSDWVRQRYLDLPPDFSQRVAELARLLTSDATNSYDRSQAIEEYLRTVPYALDVPETPIGQDSVEHFLFEAQRGYFDYHASAMVVMLRALGIPARVAVGYVVQERDRRAGTNEYVVSERNAFAWPEVYFNGYGWVEFNPSPNVPPISRPGAIASAPPAVDQPPLGEETSPPGLFDGLQPEDGGAGSLGSAAGGGSDRGRWVLFGVLAGVAAVFATLGGGLRYAWTRGLAGLDLPARAWEQTVRLASWGRLPPEPAQTPREYAASLQERVPGLDDVDAIAGAYVRGRFGRKPLDEAERSRLDAAWRRVRSTLLRRVLRLR